MNTKYACGLHGWLRLVLIASTYSIWHLSHFFFETTASFTLFLWEYILLNLFERAYTTLYWQDIYIFCREYILRLWRVYTGCIRYLLAREYIPLLIFLRRFTLLFSMEYILFNGVYPHFFMKYVLVENHWSIYHLFYGVYTPFCVGATTNDV